MPRFLGVEPDGDALDLLGLTPDQCTPAGIEASLQRQLDRIGAHAEGDTPEADEVRLALHAAAAQLLDTSTRRSIIEQREARAAASLVEATPSERVAASAHAPLVGARYQPPEDSNAPVRRVLLLAGVGGGLLVVVLVMGLIFLSPSGPSTTASTTSKSSSAAPTVGTGGTQPAIVADAPTKDADQAATVQPSGDAPTPTAPKSGRSEFVDGAQVVRDLRAASVKAKSDASAGLIAFRKAVRPLADWWPKFEVGHRRAADDAVLEFVYVVGEKPDVASEVVRELSSRAVLPPVESGPLDADAVWPAAWATGVLSRLGEERGLPRAVAAQIAEALNDMLGAGRSGGASSFESGAEAALRRMPTRLVAPANPAAPSKGAEPRSAEGIRRWADAIAVVTGEEMEQERVLTDGLEQILMSGPSAEEDRATFEAIETLVTRIKWRANGPARERLLDWFNDSRVSAGSLRVVTGVLAGKSAAEGVDPAMQLSVTASPDDRAQLRARYATVWGLAKTEARQKALEEWRSRATAASGITDVDPKDDDIARVSRLVIAVRINHAARRLWLGDGPGCSRLLGDLDRLPGTIRDIGSTPVGPTLAPTAPTPPPPPNLRPGRGIAPGRAGAPLAPFTFGDGPWAEAYLRAERNIPVRMQRLNEAEGLTMPLAKADAAVLVEAALFASPAQVRQAAQRVVGRFADDPSVVEACLDQLPLAPRIQSVSDLLNKVARAMPTKLGDPEWEIITRRALVDRMLGLLAGQGPQAGIDQASALIGESYVTMAGVDSGPPDEVAAERCIRGAGQLFKLWRLEADRLPPPERPPLTLDQIERRRRSRQQIASGPIQSFAGEQASVAELFAYVVCAERPVQAMKAGAIIEDMAKDRRSAVHVFDQLTATERAISRLWVLRFGEGAQ